MSHTTRTSSWLSTDPGAGLAPSHAARCPGWTGRDLDLEEIEGLVRVFVAPPEVTHGASAILDGMRTTLDLDDDLMGALMARHPERSRTEAVERAIETYIRDDAKQRLLALAGRLEIDDVTHERRHDRRT